MLSQRLAGVPQRVLGGIIPPKISHPVVAPGDREAVASFPASPAGLNIAEIQLSVLLPQCLDQRLPDATTLTTELQALQEQRSVSHSQVMW